ncbi:MAG: diaminohydroxyphosphoribosylaminopyrimidine deaminase [Alphaproteobacteria bacterium]|nr:diaminohydroxyphosphoribosylaminopyrimidine deaminase [Alphaproteobacteria bacterium]
MDQALELARLRLGRVAPNPAVGCLIVRNGEIIGRGATGDGGRPHAEEIALDEAGERADGATAYVSLEPCNARSSGAKSCAQRLAEAGVVRVVVACEDPNPPAAHGVSHLGAAGVEVRIGVMQAEAEELNRGFFNLVATGRPWLAIDDDPSSYDGEFDMTRSETFEQALDRIGRMGLTRIFVRAGTPLAAQLKARGLVDEER